MIAVPIKNNSENPVAFPYAVIRAPPARGAKTVPAPTVIE